MRSDDALECRRALREIREIAAVAMLGDSPRSEHEALQAMFAIADWAAESRTT